MIKADDLRLRVNSVRETRSGHVLRCSHGFKQRDGEWLNVWFDVMVSDKTETGIDAATLGKGDIVFVVGRISYSEYQGKPQWTIFADSLRMGEGKKTSRYVHATDNDIGDVPF